MRVQSPSMAACTCNPCFGRLRQEDGKFNPRLGNLMRPHLQNKKNRKEMEQVRQGLPNLENARKGFCGLERG